MISRSRRMTPAEISVLLTLDVSARLATMDAGWFPHVTPLCFVDDDGAFHMTSIADRPHLRRLARDTRAGICVDHEQPEREDGERRNRQVRAIGTAELTPDVASVWRH